VQHSYFIFVLIKHNWSEEMVTRSRPGNTLGLKSTQKRIHIYLPPKRLVGS